MTNEWPCHTIVFIIGWGGTATLLGQVFAYYKNWLGRIGGVVIILLGLSTLGLFRLPWMVYRDTRPQWTPGRGNGIMSSMLKAEDFGVLTEIDIQETLKKKLKISTEPYMILGACNPVLARRALTIAPQVGLLLPCNVTIRQLEDGSSEVALIDPLVMLGVMAHPELREVAEEARARLVRVAAALKTSQ